MIWRLQDIKNGITILKKININETNAEKAVEKKVEEEPKKIDVKKVVEQETNYEFFKK